MVCWTVNDEKAVLDSATAIGNKMEVQPNAKKCKFQDQSEMKLPPLPADPCPDLRPFCHQVGGHTQFLQLDQSTVCKPLIPRELSFYLNAPPDICTFTPKCKGVIQTWHQEGRQYWKRFAMDEISVTAEHSEISSHPNTRHDAPLRISLAGHEAISYHPAHTYTDGSSQFFMMLENVASASKFERPCVLDLKMGTRQHGDDASAEKRNRQMAKCAASTSASLGLRLCGMKVYEATSNKFFVQDKYFGRRLDADGLRKALVQFFASGGARRAGIIGAILERLRLLRKAIEQQDTFRFYSSSLLIVYEGCDENCEFYLGRDYHFLCPPPARRSSEPETADNVSCYKPARSSSDVQIPRLNEVAIQRQVSVADTNDCYLTDSCETQCFGTSPQSVDSGLDCLMMEQTSSLSSTNECCWKGVNGQSRYVGSFKSILKNSTTSYECDNSTDSTDSGVFSSPVAKKQLKKLKKRSTIYTDSEEESDAMWHHDLDDGQHVSMELSGEEDGELTPVLEVSPTEEFTADGSQTKRPVMDEDKVSPASKADNCWAACVDVRMIDFAHTTFSGYLGLDERVHWGPDNGYLFGLENLTDILSELQGFSLHQRNAFSY